MNGSRPAITALRRSAASIATLLRGLPAAAWDLREAAEKWSVREVVAHLIRCEHTAWIPRARIILAGTPEMTFSPVDMTGHFALAAQTPLPELLVIFRDERAESISALRELRLKQENFHRTALHPVLGAVTLEQLLATWVTHDLSHLAQLSRILARHNTSAVGPFERYLTILH